MNISNYSGPFFPARLLHYFLFLLYFLPAFDVYGEEIVIKGIHTRGVFFFLINIAWQLLEVSDSFSSTQGNDDDYGRDVIASNLCQSLNFIDHFHRKKPLMFLMTKKFQKITFRPKIVICVFWFDWISLILSNKTLKINVLKCSFQKTNCSKLCLKFRKFLSLPTSLELSA